VQHLCYIAHHTLKRAEALVIGALATTTRDGEVELQAPVASVPSGLNGRYDGSVGNALESLLGLAIVLSTHSKNRVVRDNGTCLMSILPVEAEMEAFGHESHTSWVGIDTVEADCSVAGRISKKIDALVSIRENATCHSSSGGCAEQSAYQQSLKIFHILKTILKKFGCKGKRIVPYVTVKAHKLNKY
jgi:hypothetical protein